MAQEGDLRLVSHQIAAHGGRLTRKYSAEGQGAKKDMSPPLEWYGVPEGTLSLALLVQDIDADPALPWTHWVVANIPPTVKGLPEGFSGREAAAGRERGGLQEGINDWKQPGWRGPVPPSHGHRIQFKLYALDDEVHLRNKVTGDKFLEAIQGYVLEEAELVAVFQGVASRLSPTTATSTQNARHIRRLGKATVLELNLEQPRPKIQDLFDVWVKLHAKS